MARLFYEDEFDALNTMIGDSGKTVKECANHLYPDMKPDSAYAKLKDQLNQKGSEELKFRQVLALMKFCETYDPLMYVCDETLHARPDRKAPADEEVKLVEAINSAAETMNKAMRQLEHLRSFGLMKAA
jgi:sulfur relay (sulfurtransferase) DsrF/TusC family protein